MKKSLNGEWLFKSTDSKEWKKATVPGCNFLDLMANGDIPDPFVGLNENKVQWVADKDWEYKKAFDINNKEIESDDVLLNCKMLDTICDVYINEKLAFSGKNCFTAYSVSIKKYLKIGENEIKIKFYSPVNYVKKKYKESPTPMNSNGLNGIVHIRKPQCHFGWDWGPVLPSSGITKNIDIEFVCAGRIDYLQVKQKVKDGSATITASVEITECKNCDCKITLTYPNGEKYIQESKTAEFLIESPELWWTKELSGKDKQPLYTVKAELFYDGQLLQTAEKKIGIRTIELNREKDEYGKNFQFILNGVPIFIKGANYIPSDSFITRFGEKELKYFLDAAQFSNMNMLRVWGGGYYESDEFYNACDERGILIWQDFQFACQAYPFFDDEFLKEVKKETEYNVKRLCHHPSLALWNGNNEIEDMSIAWKHMRNYISWTEKFFYHILEPEIRKYDDATPYTPGSPIGISHNKGVGADNVGDTHLWSVWHGLQPMNFYRKRMTRFCSEFGFESLPDIKAIEKYAEPKDYSLSSDVLKAHQKCNGGNDKMLFYIVSRFNLPVKLEDIIYLSQVTQLECIRDATEHWRRNKGRCNGSMYWQFNDCWGVCSWSGIDYYGNYKALQYGAKHFNAPLTVSFEDTEDYVKIFALNDYNEPKKIKVSCEIFDFEMGILKKDSKEIEIAPVKNEILFNYDVSKLKSKYDLSQTGMVVRMYENGKLTEQKTLLFKKEKELKLPKANLSAKISAEGDTLHISIHTDNFARLVKLESSLSSVPFSDNYFDILPNEAKDIYMKAGSDISLEKLEESINIRSLCDVELDKNSFHAFLKKAKVYASVKNLVNAMHHSKLSKDVKIDG